MKKYIFFIITLAFWFLGSLIFQSDPGYYNELIKPGFAPPAWLFGVVWPILYIMISISITIIYDKYSFTETSKDYWFFLVLNYISNQLYTFFAFTMKNNFLGFINTVLVLITGLYLYYETKKLDDKAADLLIPFLIWSVFTVFLAASIFLLNIGVS